MMMTRWVDDNDRDDDDDDDDHWLIMTELSI